MRTKTLLLTAVALAAGVASSMAQVYSVNVVGYANVVMTGQSKYTLVANPLDDGAGNNLSVLLNGLPNKTAVLTWGGVAFNTQITKTNGAWNGNTSLPPGTGFFVKNGIASSPDYTNTFVGSVVVGPGQSLTNTLAAGFNLVGSPIPFGGDVTTDASINLGGVLPNKSFLLSWNAGSQSYNTQVTKTNGAWNGAFPVAVGQGFFVNAKSTTNWSQTLP